MRIDFDLQNMISRLEYIIGVVEESGVDDSLRNVIFKVVGEQIELIGYSRIVNCRILLEESVVSDYSTMEDNEFTQIKVKPFLNFLKALASATRTRIECTYLERDGEFLKLVIEEDAVDEESEFAEFLNNQVSYKKFRILPMKEADRKALKNDKFDKETEGLVSKDIRFYLDSLLPLMDGKSDISGKMYFTKDLVYVQNSYTLLALENNLREDFSDFSLSIPVVRFLSKILVGNEIVSVGKNETFLCVTAGNMRVLMQYNQKTLDISKVMAAIAYRNDDGTPMVYTKSMVADEKMSFVNRDIGVIIDKLRMRDILKRFKTEDEGVSLSIDTNREIISIDSSTFSTSVPILYCKCPEKLNGVTLSMGIDALNNALFGDAELFTEDVFMYLTLLNKGCVVTMLDSTGAWISIIKVRYTVS